MVYRITDPAQPEFIQYINNRDFSGEEAAGDRAPEGIVFIPAADSPNGRPMIAVAHQESGTTPLFRIRRQQGDR